MTYDTADRVKSYTENGETYTYTYAYQGNPAVTSKVDSQGNLYTYGFSSVGYITNPTPPSGGGGPTQTSYNPDGTVQQFTDAVGVKTYYTYTADASPLTVTKDYQGANPVQFNYAYDPNFPDKVISITPKNPSTGQVDPTWQAWQYDNYQAADPAPSALHHVYRVESDGVTLDTLATYVYDTHGRVTQRTSATGAVTGYAYDSFGNLQTVTAAANNDSGTPPVTTYGYDSLGRVNSVTDPLGNVTSYIYDAIDRVTSVTLPKPSPTSTLNFTTTYSYDNYDSGTGLLFVNITDANGLLAKQGYDQYGQLVKSIDALADTTTYGYTRGLLTSITDANGNVTSYAYDPGRRLSSTTFPDSAVERYVYTLDSLLYQKTDRKSQTITYAYDHFKRLATKTYPGSSSIAYTYQGQKLTQVVDTSVTPSETHSFIYDSSYRVSSNTQATRGAVGYTYTADDRPATAAITGGPTATYTYYADDSLDTLVWSPVSSQVKYTYNLAGQYSQVTLPNGQTRSYSYDNQGRLLSLGNVLGATNLASYAYGYDVNNTTGLSTLLGQRSSLTANVPTQGFTNALTKYYYDPLYQLTRADYPNVAPFNSEVDSWTYDAIGNRLTNTVNGTPQTYTYFKNGANPLNGQRLSNDGVNAYTWDSNGSDLTRNGTPGNFTFGYNVDNRLDLISGAATATYTYDYQERRTSKTVSGITTMYLYDGLNPVEETTGGTVTNYAFGPGIDEPLIVNKGGTISYFNADGLGSVAGTSNAAGTFDYNSVFDAWGSVRSETGNRTSSFTYTGREVGEASLEFYRARFLQPGVGRFSQEDPLRIEAGVGLSGDSGHAVAWLIGTLLLHRPSLQWKYSYVSNSPLSNVDPLGLSEATFDNAKCTITYTTSTGQQVCYPANNATPFGGNGLTPNCLCPLPKGDFPVGTPRSTGEPSGSNGPFGPWFTPIYLPGERTGVGIHSGRSNKGPYGSATHGCIRTTDPGSWALPDLNTVGDPVTKIHVE